MNLRRDGWRAAAFGLALLSAGCADLQPAATGTAGTQAVRAYSQNIALEGRLSLQYRRNNENQAVHGSFTWEQTPGRIVLHLLSPLGQTIAVIDIEPGLATLTESGKAPRMAADVNQLTEQTLGWPLPIAGLRDWLQGFATDASGRPFTAQPSPDDATSAVTTRDGWRIQYLNWQTDPQAAPAGRAYPKRIDLERYTEQAGQVAIRIVIDKSSIS